MVELKLEDCLNAQCPFSDKPVQADSLTEFEGRVFGFCNPGCRDSFAADPAKFPEAVANFRACAEPVKNWFKPLGPIVEGLNTQPFVIAWKDSQVQIELYQPRGKDLQTPHNRDEAYIVERGSGTFSRAGELVEFGPGDVIFVPKGQAHRFETFSDDFRTWVILWS